MMNMIFKFFFPREAELRKELFRQNEELVGMIHENIRMNMELQDKIARLEYELEDAEIKLETVQRKED